MKRFIYLLLISIAVICSCDKNGIDEGMAIGGMSISQKEIQIYPGGGSVQVLLTSGSYWTLESSQPSWLTIKNENGRTTYSGEAGSVVLNLSADVNMEYFDRSALLTFTSKYGSVDLKVTQAKPYLKVRNLDSNTYLNSYFSKGFYWYASKDKQSEFMKFKIETNTWWKIIGSDPSYFISETEGEGDSEVVIVPNDLNISDRDNTTRVYIEGPDYTNIYELQLVQGHLIFQLSNTSTQTCNEYGTDISGMTVKSEVNWHLKDPVSGWSVTGNTRGTGMVGSPISTRLGTISIHPNETREQKVHALEFVPEDAEAQARNVTIVHKITQDPFVFDIEGSTQVNCSFRSPDDRSYATTMTVNSSADWFVDRVPTWVSILDNTATGKGAVGGKSSLFKIAPMNQNLNLSPRTGLILIRNGVNGMQIPVEVVQKEFKFSITKNNSSNLESLPQNETEEYRWFDLVTSGPWYIESHPDWIDFKSDIKGTNNNENTIRIYYKANSSNTAEADREGNVVFVSELHKGTSSPLSKSIRVIQNGFKFYLGNSESSEDDKLNEFSELGDETQTIKVVSPTKWRASANAGWVHLSQTEGQAGADVKVSVDMNKTKVHRTAIISFTNNEVNNGKGKTIDVAVSQAPYIFDVDFGGSSMEVEPLLNETSRTRTVKVQSSGKWTVASNAPWVTFTSNGANSGANFNIKIDDNNTLSQRTATVTVTNHDLTSDNTSTFTITQKPFVFTAKEQSPLEFAALSDDQSFQITYECSSSIQITAPDWCQCVDNTRGTITVTATPNLGEGKRDGVIEISNRYTSETIKINVLQIGYKFIHNGNSSYSIKRSGNDPLYIQIQSAGKWSVSSDVAWVKPTPLSGTGDSTLTITFVDNTEPGSRSGKVTILCEDNKERKYTINFYQEAGAAK